MSLIEEYQFTRVSLYLFANVVKKDVVRGVKSGLDSYSSEKYRQLSALR